MRLVVRQGMFSSDWVLLERADPLLMRMSTRRRSRGAAGVEIAQHPGPSGPSSSTRRDSASERMAARRGSSWSCSSTATRSGSKIAPRHEGGPESTLRAAATARGEPRAAAEKEEPPSRRDGDENGGIWGVRSHLSRGCSSCFRPAERYCCACSVLDDCALSDWHLRCSCRERARGSAAGSRVR